MKLIVTIVAIGKSYRIVCTESASDVSESQIDPHDLHLKPSGSFDKLNAQRTVATRLAL